MRRVAWVAALATLAACTIHIPGDDPPTAPSSAPVASLQLHGPSAATVGDRVIIHVQGFDAHGVSVSTANADVTSADSVSAYLFFSYLENTSLKVQDYFAEVHLVRAGTAWIRGALGGVRDSIAIAVAELQPRTTALALVDFEMIEDRTIVCGATCGRVAYFPILRVHEPTGTAAATVLGAEFTVPQHSSQLCTTSVRIAGGATVDASRREPDLSANALLIVNDGGPVAGGFATARVLVQSAAGDRGWLFATGPITRNSALTLVPEREVAVALQPGWSCLAG
jgi:hypothetical protein